jgi:UDP-glucose 4-epimerase
MKRVLLTGGSGFIGRNIRESHLAERYEILAPSHAELDVSDDASVERFFRGNRIDCVIHAATKPGHRNAKDPTNLFYTNTRMFFNLARFCDRYDKMIVLGSGAIYDMRQYHGLMEEDEWRVRLPADDHGFVKHVCANHIENSKNVVELRVFGVFGRYEDYAIRFISNMICKSLFDLPLTMRQNRVFSYLFIDDLMPVLEHFLEHETPHRSFNVVPDERCELLNLARMVLEITRKELPVLVEEEGYGLEYSGSNARLRREMPDLVFTDLRAAIEGLHAWYLEHRESIDKDVLFRNC